MLNCIAFTFADDGRWVTPQDGERQASKTWVRFKVFSGYNVGETNGAWYTAIKPWPLTGDDAHVDNITGTARGPTDACVRDGQCEYRECHMWASQGHCQRNPAIMRRHLLVLVPLQPKV